MIKKLVQRTVNLDTKGMLLLILCLDGIAILFAWLHGMEVLESRFYRMGRDFGFWELVEHIKVGLVIFMIYQCWKRFGDPVYRAWMILFSVMLADNFLGLHEEIAEIIINNFEVPWLGLRREKDAAELVVMMILEGSACMFVLYSYFVSGDVARRYSHSLGALFALFVLFAFVFDAIGFRVTEHHQYIEELAELLVISLILLWVHHRYRETSISANVSEFAETH